MSEADDLLRRVLRHFNKTDYTLALQEDIEKYLDTKDNPDCKSVQKRLEIQEKAEPVAYCTGTYGGRFTFELMNRARIPVEGEVFYSHPPRPIKQITCEELAYGFTEPLHSQWQAFVAGARWAERHHGIGEKE